ncbi:MAG TPA: hypothetical protein VF065_13260, partial [Ilumatobacter sp.]
MPVGLVRLVALQRRQHQRIVSLERPPTCLVVPQPLQAGADVERRDLLPQLRERLGTHADILRMGLSHSTEERRHHHLVPS